MKEIKGHWEDSLHDMVLKAASEAKKEKAVFFKYNNMKVTVEILYDIDPYSRG